MPSAIRTEKAGSSIRGAVAKFCSFVSIRCVTLLGLAALDDQPVASIQGGEHPAANDSMVLEASIDGLPDSLRRIEFANWALRQPAPPVDSTTALDDDVIVQLQWLTARSVQERIEARETSTQAFLQEGLDLHMCGDVACWVGEA